VYILADAFLTLLFFEAIFRNVTKKLMQITWR